MSNFPRDLIPRKRPAAPAAPTEPTESQLLKGEPKLSEGERGGMEALARAAAKDVGAEWELREKRRKAQLQQVGLEQEATLRKYGLK